MTLRLRKSISKASILTILRLQSEKIIKNSVVTDNKTLCSIFSIFLIVLTKNNLSLDRALLVISVSNLSIEWSVLTAMATSSMRLKLTNGNSLSHLPQKKIYKSITKNQTNLMLKQKKLRKTKILNMTSRWRKAQKH